ncbi:MAG: hypothetical protein ACYDD6_08950, partial [Acidimicrobiales bacterium]
MVIGTKRVRPLDAGRVAPAAGAGTRRTAVTRSAVRALAQVLAVTGVVLLGTVGLGRLHDTSKPNLALAAGSDFTIASAITASYPGCSGATALLYPGVQRCIAYSVHNNLPVPITVQSITIATDPSSPPPPSCPGSELDLSGAGFSGSFTVPPDATATSPGEPISMVDNGNQDACQNVKFQFVYSASAAYSKVSATSTSLSSSQNPTIVGRQVTFTATVSSTPAGPATGAVSFYDG